MTDADRPHLAKMLAVLGSVFNETVDDLKAEGYFAALRDLAWEDVRTAGYACLQTENFFPRPARLRALITGSAEDQADAAWNGLLREIHREGHTGKPNLPDETWEIVTEIWGSWRHLCETLPAEGPELLGWAKRFKSSYGSAQRVAARMSLPLFPPRQELSE